MMRRCHCGGEPKVRFDEGEGWAYAQCGECGATGPPSPFGRYSAEREWDAMREQQEEEIAWMNR